MQVVVEILRRWIRNPPNFNWLRGPKLHTAQDIVDEVKHHSFVSSFLVLAR